MMNWGNMIESDEEKSKLTHTKACIEINATEEISI